MLALRPQAGAPIPAKLYIVVAGLEAYYARIVAAGVDVTYALAVRDYGMKDCRVVDPDGNEISFGEPTR